ncbi:MAG: hypothetical protein LAQ69_48920, partial [Acidobacteriia bacterium]|nr:hypothetical protein [Terriglobia bacterium]
MRRNYLGFGAALMAALVMQNSGRAADARVRVFGASQVQEVYRVLLDRGALLLESIVEVIKEKDIQDGEVLVT